MEPADSLWAALICSVTRAVTCQCVIVLQFWHSRHLQPPPLNPAWISATIPMLAQNERLFETQLPAFFCYLCTPYVEFWTLLCAQISLTTEPPPERGRCCQAKLRAERRRMGEMKLDSMQGTCHSCFHNLSVLPQELKLPAKLWEPDKRRCVQIW